MGRMNDTAVAVQDPVERDDTDLAGYIDNASRYDGSRTAPQKIALIHLMKREGRTVNAISEILGMDDRTVKAILARGDTLVTDARMLLQANALGFAGDAILASQEAAKKGKIEGISAMLDRLGVTEPPKSQAQTSVGVQVILHGGPAPGELSPAKQGGESLEISEGQQIQAQSVQGPIIGLMNTSELPQPQSFSVTELSSVAHAQPSSQSPTVSQQDNTQIQASKCQVATGGDHK